MGKFGFFRKIGKMKRFNFFRNLILGILFILLLYFVITLFVDNDEIKTMPIVVIISYVIVLAQNEFKNKK